MHTVSATHEEVFISMQLSMYNKRLEMPLLGAPAVPVRYCSGLFAVTVQICSGANRYRL